MWRGGKAVRRGGAPARVQCGGGESVKPGSDEARSCHHTGAVAPEASSPTAAGRLHPPNTMGWSAGLGTAVTPTGSPPWELTFPSPSLLTPAGSIFTSPAEPPPSRKSTVLEVPSHYCNPEKAGRFHHKELPSPGRHPWGNRPRIGLLQSHRLSV